MEGHQTFAAVVDWLPQVVEQLQVEGQQRRVSELSQAAREWSAGDWLLLAQVEARGSVRPPQTNQIPFGRLGPAFGSALPLALQATESLPQLLS